MDFLLYRVRSPSSRSAQPPSKLTSIVKSVEWSTSLPIARRPSTVWFSLPLNDELCCSRSIRCLSIPSCSLRKSIMLWWKKINGYSAIAVVESKDHPIMDGWQSCLTLRGSPEAYWSTNMHWAEVKRGLQMWKVDYFDKRFRAQLDQDSHKSERVILSWLHGLAINPPQSLSLLDNRFVRDYAARQSNNIL